MYKGALGPAIVGRTVQYTCRMAHPSLLCVAARKLTDPCVPRSVPSCNLHVDGPPAEGFSAYSTDPSHTLRIVMSAGPPRTLGLKLGQIRHG